MSTLIRDTHDPLDDLSNKAVARGTFWLCLAALVPTLPLLAMHTRPDWLVIPALSLAIPAVLGALASAAEYVLRR